MNNIKEEIEKAEDELRSLLKEKIARLKKRDSVRDAHGNVVKQPVRNARGELLNR